MKVKVCGMRERENVLAVDQLGAVDYIGFIFFDESPRNIARNTAGVMEGLRAQKVGVFVNEKVKKVVDIVEKFDLAAVQLHGEEDQAYCLEIKEKLKEISLFKAIGIKEKTDFDQLHKYGNEIEMFILDTKGKSRGGNGISWQHELLKDVDIPKPFLLSGGIDPTFDLNKLGNLHPMCKGVDLNSGFESEPALKDILKLKKFLRYES